MTLTPLILSEGESISYLNAEGCHFQQCGYEQSALWFLTHIEFFLDKSDSPRLLLISDKKGRDLAVLPLLVASAGKLKINIIKPIASYYTSLFQPLKLQDDLPEKESARAVATYLADSAEWDYFQFGPISADSKFAKALVEEGKNNRLYVKEYFWFENWFLDCSGLSFEQYYSSLPSKLKNTISRKKRKLEKQGEVTFKVFSRPQDIGRALREFEAVYSASWKKPEGKPAFIEKFSEGAALNGWTRIGVLYANSTPCAVQLWYVTAGVGSIFKLAHDEKYKAYSVGSILTLEMLRHAIDVDGVGKIDFLIGGDGYKKDWGFKMQERWGLAIFNRTFKGRVLAFRHIFLSRLKSLVLDQWGQSH